MRDVRSLGQTVHSGAAAVQTTVPSLLSGPARLLLGGEGGSIVVILLLDLTTALQVHLHLQHVHFAYSFIRVR